jgi:hypothetical protein
MRFRRLIACSAASALAIGAVYLIAYATILAITVGFSKAPRHPMPPPGPPPQVCELFSGTAGLLCRGQCIGCANKPVPNLPGSSACPCVHPTQMIQVQARFVTQHHLRKGAVGDPNEHELFALDSLPAKATFSPVGDWRVEGIFDGLSFSTTVAPVGTMTVDFSLDERHGEPVYIATITHMAIRASASQGFETVIGAPRETIIPQRPTVLGLARLLPLNAPWIAKTDTSAGPAQPILTASLMTIRPDNGSTGGFLAVLFSSPTDGFTLQGEVTGTFDFADGSWSFTFSASQSPNGLVICDVDGDSEVRRNDIKAILAARGTPAIPGDSRDADGDGLITVNDARICVLACTKPNCVP